MKKNLIFLLAALATAFQASAQTMEQEYARQQKMEQQKKLREQAEEDAKPKIPYISDEENKSRALKYQCGSEAFVFLDGVAFHSIGSDYKNNIYKIWGAYDFFASNFYNKQYILSGNYYGGAYLNFYQKSGKIFKFSTSFDEVEFNYEKSFLHAKSRSDRSISKTDCTFIGGDFNSFEALIMFRK